MSKKRKRKKLTGENNKITYKISHVNKYYVIPERRWISTKTGKVIKKDSKVKHKRKETTQEWLSHIWDLNVETLNEHEKKRIEDALKSGVDVNIPKDPKTAFMQHIFGRMNAEGMDEHTLFSKRKEIVEEILRKKSYMPKWAQMKENLVEGLTELKMFNKFRGYLKDDRGKFVKFDAKKIEYDKSSKTYIYHLDNKRDIIIDFTDSPRNVTFKYKDI